MGHWCSADLTYFVDFYRLPLGKAGVKFQIFQKMCVVFLNFSFFGGTGV
jgi:hypothetical protein